MTIIYISQSLLFWSKYNTGGPKTVLAISVEMEEGCVEHIEMKEGQTAKDVATKFCQAHDLPLQFVGPLMEHIKDKSPTTP